MMTVEGSTKFINFMTPGAEFLMSERGYINHCSELSSTLSIYSTLIAMVLRDYNAAFLCYCCFLFNPPERSSGGYIEITLSVRLSVQIRVRPIMY